MDTPQWNEVTGDERLRGEHSPLIARHVEVGAQCPPHIAWFGTSLDGVRGSAPHPGEHMINQHRRPIDGAEPAGDQFVEFGQPHATNLPGHIQRLMAHLYRIGDVRDAGARGSGGVPVAM